MAFLNPNSALKKAIKTPEWADGIARITGIESFIDKVIEATNVWVAEDTSTDSRPKDVAERDSYLEGLVDEFISHEPSHRAWLESTQVISDYDLRTSLMPVGFVLVLASNVFYVHLNTMVLWNLERPSEITPRYRELWGTPSENWSKRVHGMLGVLRDQTEIRPDYQRCGPLNPYFAMIPDEISHLTELNAWLGVETSKLR